MGKLYHADRHSCPTHLAVVAGEAASLWRVIGKSRGGDLPTYHVYGGGVIQCVVQ